MNGKEGAKESMEENSHLKADRINAGNFNNKRAGIILYLIYQIVARP